MRAGVDITLAKAADGSVTGAGAGAAIGAPPVEGTEAGAGGTAGVSVPTFGLSSLQASRIPASAPTPSSGKRCRRRRGAEPWHEMKDFGVMVDGFMVEQIGMAKHPQPATSERK